MGRNSDEGGVPVTVEGADPLHSPASRLPQVRGLDTDSWLNPDPVEDVRGYEGLGRTRTKAVRQSPLRVLTHCIRQKAHSHRSAVWTRVSKPTPTILGSTADNVLCANGKHARYATQVTGFSTVRRQMFIFCPVDLNVL
ncbi:hypothetical protein SAMN03159444_05420 [Pseudomonas sp. NFACC02]|nr:hypothetical protein SAMN03159444_05420 [Pseudomonas sp. NFACC02]